MRYILESSSDRSQVETRNGRNVGYITGETFVGKHRHYKVVKKSLGGHLVPNHVTFEELEKARKQAAELPAHGGEDAPSRHCHAERCATGIPLRVR